MGRSLTNTMERTPVVSVREKAGQYFEGTLQTMGREVKMKKGKGLVFEFVLIDTDMGITIKDEAGNIVEKDVEAGDKVSVFAPTVLAKALGRAKLGEHIRLVYKGKAAGKNGGADYHDYDVEVI